ncbi:hypothetical protein ACFL6W_02055 [Thermodesulfobacteriota bacterium]
MKRNTMEISLKIILRISGIMLITAFGAVLLPYDTMARIHQQIGLGNLPNAPILDYLARSVSLFYAMHGVIAIYISFNLMRYLQILKLLCYLGFLFGIALFIIDIKAPMPAYWAFTEGPIILSLNLAIYILANMLERNKH